MAIQCFVFFHQGRRRPAGVRQPNREAADRPPRHRPGGGAHPVRSLRGMDLPGQVRTCNSRIQMWIFDAKKPNTSRYQWSLDKLVLTDSDGEKKSFCKDVGMLLPSGKNIIRTCHRLSVIIIRLKKYCFISRIAGETSFEGGRLRRQHQGVARVPHRPLQKGIEC